MSIRSFYLDSRDVAGQLEEVTADNYEDVEVINQLIIEEYAEKEQARLEDYLLEILPKEKWALTLLGVLRDILAIFSDYELNDTKVQWFDKNEYNMFETCLDRVCNLVEKYGLVGDNESLAKEMNNIYRKQGFSVDDEEQTPEPQQGAPEPQQGEQEARQRQHKQLGRKRKALKELIVPTDKETIYSRLQLQMEGASNDVAMNILINAIINKTLLKPSYGTFKEAFPTITIPESTYYDKLKKAGIR